MGNVTHLNFRSLTILFFVFFYSITLDGQLHLDLEQSGNFTFEEIVKQSEDHFNIVGKGKGVGYKQFQRWQYWAKRNLDQNGFVRSNKSSLSAFNKFKKENQTSSKNLTESYQEMGPRSATVTSSWSSGLGRVTAIGLDPNDTNHILIGAPGGGIWNTNDLGVNWTPIFDDQALISVYALEISHANSDHYYAGLSKGVVRSLDAGLTWTSVAGLSSSQLYNTITMHPTNANIVFAVAQGAGIVYKSTDGGSNFYPVMDHYSGLHDLEFHPATPSVIYASGDDAVYVSTNEGESFTEVVTGPWSGSGNTMMMAVTPAAANNVYVLEEMGGGFNAIYLSQNAGQSWTVISDNACNCNNIMGYNLTVQNGQGPRDMDIVVSPIDPNIIHVGGVETWRSSDLGQNWEKTTYWGNPGGTNFIHADIDILIYADDRIVAGTDGGIYYSTDEASSWADISEGLGIRQFYRIGASQTDSDRVSGGSQDNGTGVVRNGTWYDFIGADGMETFIDYANEDIIYGTVQNGNLYKSLDGGITTSPITTPSGAANWVTPLEQDPMDPNTIYTARNQVYKSTDAGGSWSAISNFSLSALDELKIAPTDNNYIYTSFIGNVIRTNNGGGTWNITSIPGSQVNYISVHPTDPLRLTVALSGTASKIMESHDGGATWVDLTANMPNVGVQCVTYDPNGLGGIYAGGTVGIYYYDTLLGSWSTVSNNLPKVNVTELEIRNQVLYVATYGRGLWKYDLPCDMSTVGRPCTDYDKCTINDIYDADCNCVGTFADADDDGVCTANDPDDTNECIPNNSDPSCNEVCTIYSFDSFENGFGSWVDGGSDCAISTKAEYAFTGSGSVRLADDSGAASSIYSPFLDLSEYSKIKLSYAFKTNSMEFRENFFVEISTTPGSSNYSILKDFVSGYDFENGQFYLDTITILAADLSATTRFRFRCDASGNNDQVYIDDIVIETCSSDGAGCTEGSPCDDGNACTSSDVYDVDCNCVGTIDDADNDGVCDASDVCPGFDDNIDSDNDGTPDGCDDCNNNSSSFTPDPLTHSGSGSSASLVSLTNQEDVAFAVSSLGSKVNGNPGNRYVDLVDIYYVDGAGVESLYGSYSGANTSEVNVVISGSVVSVRVELSDGYDGNGPSMSVGLSEITSCENSSQSLVSGTDFGSNSSNLFLVSNETTSLDFRLEEVKIFPNPANDLVNISLVTSGGIDYELNVKNILGQSIISRNFRGVGNQHDIQLDCSSWMPGMYVIALRAKDKLILKTIVVQ